jgi:hypothetical protein
MTLKTRAFTLSWEQHGRYLLTVHARVRCIGSMTLIWALVRNLRTGSVMLREKAPSGEPTRPTVPMHRPGAHCPVVAWKRSNVRGAKGAGHPRRAGVNGQPEELLVLAEAGRLPRGGTSRMNREVHVRICERPGAKFPGPTRQFPGATRPKVGQGRACNREAKAFSSTL